MNTLKIFRMTSVLEGISLVLLFFVAMPLKYGFDMPLAVRIVGSAHGALFIAFVAILVWAQSEQEWSLVKTAKLFVSCLIPFGFIWAERLVREDAQTTPAA